MQPHIKTMKLGQVYNKEVIKKYHSENQPHTEYRYGCTLDKKFFIKFGVFEFWETDVDHEFKCTRNEEEGELHAKADRHFGTAIKLPDNTRSRSYYERDNKASREAMKWGYRPNG